MCAVPILQSSQLAAGGAIMNRGLLAPLSRREISHLLHLSQGGDFQPDPAAFKRFGVLGLVEERPDGFAITELGRQRLDSEPAMPPDPVRSCDRRFVEWRSRPWQ
jgi:hypothetical protein